MKIINYGPGYEPTTLICSNCKSELEYTNIDIEIKVLRDYVYNPILVISYITCPICGKEIEIKKEK